ncbi:MAG: 3-methyladenine DNA glycosylase [Nocardioides sp.]
MNTETGRVHVPSPDEVATRRAAHEHRIDRYVEPHLRRRGRGETHPVHDFFFTYYSHPPARLRHWHPGYGVAAPGGTEIGVEYVEARRPLIEGLHRLLAATASRTGNFGCFGLHEWAMVYQLDESALRHGSWPLRLGGGETDRVVEQAQLTCTHFDAFRFFAPGARSLNLLTPRREDRARFEQPSCLHANMDLYRHAFRLSPMIPSELLADCFELAWDIRVLDMRAAPYDLTGLTLDPTGEKWTPVRIETADGRAEYVRRQRDFATRAMALRNQLIESCRALLAHS